MAVQLLGVGDVHLPSCEGGKAEADKTKSDINILKCCYHLQSGLICACSPLSPQQT